MAKLRWVLLGLYVALLLTLGSAYILAASSGQEWAVSIGVCVFHVVSQLVFLLTPGRPQYLVPIEPRRLLIPVLIAGLLMALLVVGVVASLWELLRFSAVFDTASGRALSLTIGFVVNWVIWAAILYVPAWRTDRRTARRLIVPALLISPLLAVLTAGVIFAMLGLLVPIVSSDSDLGWFYVTAAAYWLLWATFFYLYCRRVERFIAIRRLVTWLLAGSLLQLLATVPSHIIVSRRPGCFIGLWSGLGLVAGLYVMIWSFGPGIILLFWAETRRQMRGHCPACGYDLHGLSEPRCPECGRPFTFTEVRATPEELGFARSMG